MLRDITASARQFPLALRVVGRGVEIVADECIFWRPRCRRGGGSHKKLEPHVTKSMLTAVPTAALASLPTIAIYHGVHSLYYGPVKAIRHCAVVSLYS
eukprot:scaffold26757_cov34-Prasinocladus_malaysianus.AAC.1